MALNFNIHDNEHSIPQGEYHLIMRIINIETGEHEDKKFILHEGKAFQELLDMGRQGILNPKNPDDVELVGNLLEALYQAGESSVVSMADALGIGDEPDEAKSDDNGLRPF